MGFEIKKPEFTNKTFRLPKKLCDKLSIVAQNGDISVNELVVQCCEYALADMDKSAEGSNIDKDRKE